MIREQIHVQAPGGDQIFALIFQSLSSPERGCILAVSLREIDNRRERLFSFQSLLTLFVKLDQFLANVRR